jgi:hypothetical protein
VLRHDERAGQERKLGRASQGQTGVDCPVEVVYRRIDQLKPDPRNPRRHTAKQIRQIAESIRSFGFNVPILVDADHKVIAGHGRLLACRQLGRAEVPTIRLEHLSDAQARAFMVADNRLTEIAGWDDRLLGEQLRELADLTLDFSLEVTGFEMAEIDLLIERASVQPRPIPTMPACRWPPDQRSPGRVIPGCSVRTGCIAAALSTRPPSVS